MPTREETRASGVDWDVYCKPVCTASQRKGIQRLLFSATEKDGFVLVEQEHVRTLIRMSKARKYDAARDLIQKRLPKFPGVGAEGLWTLHVVLARGHLDAESNSATVPSTHSPGVETTALSCASFHLCQQLPAPALALKCALLSRGDQHPPSPYAMSNDLTGNGGFGSVCAALGPA